MWAARSWNRVWKKQGLPQRGYEILEAKFGEQINNFHNIAKNIFANGAGAPDGFNTGEKVGEIRTAVAGMFRPGADSASIDSAYDIVDAKWREFSSAFVSSNMVNKGNAGFNFEEDYQKAMDALRSFGTLDSVRGLIEFCRNRVVWAGKAAETRIDDDLKQYGDGALNYFYNQYQVEAGKAGAQRSGYLSNEVDDDYKRLSKGYENSIRTLLLVGVNPDDVEAAMDMSKIVWKASREQFKYMLAMNDIVYKAELQLKHAEDGSEDKKAWTTLNSNRPQIAFSSAPEDKWYLAPAEFWRIFTAPSLKAMLHYSVNSYTNKAVVIDNPLADAFLAHKAKEEQKESEAASAQAEAAVGAAAEAAGAEASAEATTEGEAAATAEGESAEASAESTGEAAAEGAEEAA